MENSFSVKKCQKLNEISHFAIGCTILFISVRDVDTVDRFLHIILYAKTCNFRQPDVKKLQHITGCPLMHGK